jgi:hypothetical protein
VGVRVGAWVGLVKTVTAVLWLSDTGEPSSSTPETVTMLSNVSPGLPKMVSENMQVYLPLGPGWMTMPTEQFPFPCNGPKESVVRLVMVTGSVEDDVFSMMTVYVTGSPGAKTNSGLTV